MKKSRLHTMPCLIVGILAAAVMVGMFPGTVRAEAPAALKQLDEAFVQVAKKVTPAVVNISASKKQAPGPMGGDPEMYKNHPFKDFFGEEFFKRFKNGPEGGGGFRQQGMGSGVIVDAEGIILTNAHVVKDADDIKVKLGDNRTFTAKVLGADTESDVAVIKIDAKGLPIAKLGDSGKLRVGEIVLAIGNPFGLNQTVTSGIISATGRTNVGIIDYEDFIQTDAAINPGNSGGPLVNIEGDVIGVNTAIASRSGGYMGIGFAIPSNSAKLIMEDLLKTGKVRRGLLGVNIQDLDPNLAKSFGRNESSGALVSQVIEGSPAEKAGVKAGDIIVKFNGEPVNGAAHLKNMVGREKPGASSTLSIYRNKKTFDVAVTVGERTQQTVAQAEGSSQSDASNELGLELEKVPAAAAGKMGLKEGEGLRVKDLNPDGVGRVMGLRPGDVILEVDDAPVAGVVEFNKSVEEAKKNKVIRLKVQRGNSKIFLAGPLG
jgi:serine protease Do